MKNRPLVSIVIPVYNGSNYLGEAIDSALGQTYSNIEVLVINDGSRDNGKTREVALSYGDKIRYFEKENGGVSTALNLGVREMKGEYFSWLSHDDLYYPNKIEEQINYLEDYDEKKILFSDYDIIDSNGNFLKTNKIEYENGKSDMRFELLSSFPIHGCSTLIYRQILKDYKFDEALRVVQDYKLWFDLASKYNFFHVPKALIKSRFHSDQGTLRLNKTNIIEISKFYNHAAIDYINSKYLSRNEIIELLDGLVFKGNSRIALGVLKFIISKAFFDIFTYSRILIKLIILNLRGKISKFFDIIFIE